MPPGDQAARNRRASHLRSETERILDLPCRVLSETKAQSLVEVWTTRFSRHRPNPRPLRPIQALLLEEASKAAEIRGRGLLGSIGVGAGKTLPFMLFPEVFDAKRPALLLPPDMVEQTQRDRWEWGQYYRFRDVTIVPYSQLSQPEATDLLRRLAPDLIMADEVHALRYAEAARTTRFLRYMKECPDTRFVGMSGTLTGNALKDFAHLSRLALDSASPLPLTDTDLKVWGGVLDAGSEAATSDWVKMLPLVQWASRNAKDSTLTRKYAEWSPISRGAVPSDLDTVREAFNLRFSTAPGVVCTTTPSCDSRLILTGRKDLALDTKAAKALEVLHKEYALPDGTDVVDALHFSRAAAQLSMGFYYVWDWKGEPDFEWLEARNEWASACRWYLKRYSREGCDSPFLVEEYTRAAISEGRAISRELTDALRAWDGQRHKPAPPVRAVWLDYGPIAWAVKWARDRKAAFLWYSSRAVGEQLALFGLPVFGADQGTPSFKEHPVCALSTAVFHKGKNFQAWCDQLVLEVPRSATIWEQLLGRTHRQGQRSDEVRCDIALHTWPSQQGVAAAVAKARYIQAATGQPQRLVFADKIGIDDILTEAQNPYIGE